MNEWGFIGQDIFVGIAKSATSARPEVLNLKKSMAISDWKVSCFVTPTHHSVPRSSTSVIISSACCI